MVNVSDRFNRGLNNSGYDTDCAKRFVENKPSQLTAEKGWQPRGTLKRFATTKHQAKALFEEIKRRSETSTRGVNMKSERNRKNRIPQSPMQQIGNLAPFAVIKASDVYSKSSEEELTETLRTFNYTETLKTLARINLLLQRSENLSESERILREHFCDRLLRNKIKRKGLTEHFIFNRESTLRLLSESARVADPRSTRSPDSTGEARHALAKCYLIANESIGSNIPDVGPEATEEQRKAALVGLIPAQEYAVRPLRSARWKHTLVRSQEFLKLFLEIESPTFDVNETFSKVTELTRQDYQHLIFGIFAVPMNFSEKEILNGEVLFIDTKRDPRLTPLYDELLRHTCISIDDLARKAAKPPALLNDFLLWREYPLVKIGEDQIMCIDIGFLADKLETGVFWTIRNQLERNKTGRGQEIIQLRGDVFEDYTASIIERGINAQIPPRMERCIIQPEYIEGKGKQRPDIAVCGHETLILLECKAPLLSAETKLSGDFCTFYTEIKNKIIKRKGIEQLWNAIQALGHTNKAERCRVEGIDIFRVKRIYPVLVLSDYLFALPLMNWFLDSEFQRFVKRNNLADHLKIRPLTVLTIEDLERLEPLLGDTKFHVHLEKWRTQYFLRNDSLPFSEYFRSRGTKVDQNTYIDRKMKVLSDDIKEYFAALGID
jgi:hypothetical protein